MFCAHCVRLYCMNIDPYWHFKHPPISSSMRLPSSCCRAAPLPSLSSLLRVELLCVEEQGHWWTEVRTNQCSRYIWRVQTSLTVFLLAEAFHLFLLTLCLFCELPEHEEDSQSEVCCRKNWDIGSKIDFSYCQHFPWKYQIQSASVLSVKTLIFLPCL